MYNPVEAVLLHDKQIGYEPDEAQTQMKHGHFRTLCGRSIGTNIKMFFPEHMVHHRGKELARAKLRRWTTTFCLKMRLSLPNLDIPSGFGGVCPL